MPKKHNSATAGIINYTDYYMYFIQRLKSIAVSCFQWENLPLSVSQRFLEISTLRRSFSLFFKDDVLDEFFAMRCILQPPFDNYNIPMIRAAYANNRYRNVLNNTNSVIIFDNYLHEPAWPALCMFAQQLTNIEVTKAINLRAQKTPVMILCDDKQRLTMENLFMKIDCGAPVIYGTKNLDLDSVKVLNLEAPYLVDKLQEEKINVLHEAFSFLGVGSLEIVKRERYITNEIQAANESNIAQRANRLKARTEAAEHINDMFGLELSVSYSPIAEQIADDMLRRAKTMEFDESGLNSGGANDGGVYNPSPNDM